MASPLVNPQARPPHSDRATGQGPRPWSPAVASSYLHAPHFRPNASHLNGAPSLCPLHGFVRARTAHGRRLPGGGGGNRGGQLRRLARGLRQRPVGGFALFELCCLIRHIGFRGAAGLFHELLTFLGCNRLCVVVCAFRGKAAMSATSEIVASRAAGSSRS